MRLIDADELLKRIKDYPYGYRGMIENDIAQMPTIEQCKYWDNESNFCGLYRPAAIKHGRWVKLFTDNYKCSECGSWWGSDYNDEIINDFNYCPNCGADMREVTECD